jgi:hypothetical protein
MGEVLAGLKSRVFLMNNVHEDVPVVFQTRWALSYLRGPLTRAQIQTLMAPRKEAQAAKATAPAAPTPPPDVIGSAVGARPVLAPEVPQYFLPVATPAAGARLVYRPALLGTADLHYVDAKLGLDQWHAVGHLVPLADQVPSDAWAKGTVLPNGAPELLSDPESGIEFSSLPSEATQAKRYDSWAKKYKTHLYQTVPLTLFECPSLTLVSRPGESEADFVVRVREASREKRDEAIEKLRKQYASKLDRLEARKQTADRKVQVQEAQYQQAKAQTAISVGATVLGALFGRKAVSVGTVGRASTAARGVGRAAREKGDIERAQQEVEGLQAQLDALAAELEQELEAVRASMEEGIADVSEKTITPRKADIAIGKVALAWTPWRVDEHGIAEPAYR